MANNSSDQFDDLPLPDMEASWQKMKELLDKKDDKKPLIPFTLRSGGVLFLILLLCSALIWFIVKNNDTDLNKNTSKQSSTTPNRNSTTSVKDNGKEVNIETSGNQSTPAGTDNITGMPEVDLPKATDNSNTNTTTNIADVQLKSDAPKTLNTTMTAGNKNRKHLPSKMSNNVIKGTVADDESKDHVQNKVNKPEEASITNADQDKTDSLTTVNKTSENEVVQKLSATVDTNKTVVKLPNDVQADSLNKKKNFANETNTNLTTDKTRSKKRLAFSAGIGLQQQIPLGGQMHIAYNYNGRKTSIGDHIPSVYLRLEKDKKWFIQAEFRYAAPQSLKDFSYNRKTRLTDSFKVLTTTHYYLKKTYYHQVPVSFNYYVVPNLSVGGGIIYNRFHGAVTEREVATKNFSTQQELVSKQLVSINHFNDTFLYKTQLQYLLQAEYHVRRFTFGLRFTNDLEPYIKFTRPDGEILSKKNKTLQAMIRFRLWESKK